MIQIIEVFNYANKVISTFHTVHLISCPIPFEYLILLQNFQILSFFFFRNFHASSANRPIVSISFLIENIIPFLVPFLPHFYSSHTLTTPIYSEQKLFCSSIFMMKRISSDDASAFV